MIKNKLKTEISDYYECNRCNINSEHESRMCPCPRGGCEAEVVGEKKVVTTITKKLKSNHGTTN